MTVGSAGELRRAWTSNTIIEAQRQSRRRRALRRQRLRARRCHRHRRLRCGAAARMIAGATVVPTALARRRVSFKRGMVPTRPQFDLAPRPVRYRRMIEVRLKRSSRRSNPPRDRRRSVLSRRSRRFGTGQLPTKLLPSATKATANGHATPIQVPDRPQNRLLNRPPPPPATRPPRRSCRPRRRTGS